jgi:ankyrin repeat protein
MRLAHLPYNASLADYVKQADALFAGWQARDEEAVSLFRARHPKFLDATIPWLERQLTDQEVRATPITRQDASLALSRWYDFADWQRLTEHVEAVTTPGSPVACFEAAVESVIDGDVATLTKLLREDPSLVRARSTRVTHFDPPVHGAMLLHYLAANGVEGYRQRSPKNAADVAKVLLEAGADPNALCSLYGSRCTTMALLVSSTPPDQAGVQVALVDVLVDYGATIAPAGEGNWTSPIETALVFGKHEAAKALVRRGARIDTVAAAAGLGRVHDVRGMLPTASAEDRHRALALASQLGHADVVRVLLDAGEDPNRFNPPGTHSHSCPLHQAIAGGHLDVVKLLIDGGARLDIKDTIYQATPLGWAEYCEKSEVAAFLRARGAAS